MHSTGRTERLHTDLTIHLVLSATEAVPIEVRFSYDSADPLAVRLDFRGGPGTTAPWLFSRDLLNAGLHGPSGEGDVRVWPPCRCHGPTTVRIVLRGRGGAAALYVPATAFRGWLTETFEVVPAGAEGSHMHWDDVVAELLRRD
ncbi:SsgA family sporulation/cell division regulator [Streptomyces sp. NPDC101165]|uniref:SsgA family sporulation/cell division regulator n=1 Tax=Streptomyces sp. NPDC101165 TaxID=3366119 RepID=UPI0037FD6C8D